MTAPRGLMMVDGKLIARSWFLVHRTKAILCRAGHTIEDFPSLLEGASARACPESDCPFGVYLVASFMGFHCRIDLTAGEAEEIRRRMLRAEEVLPYTGVTGVILPERVA